MAKGIGIQMGVSVALKHTREALGFFTGVCTHAHTHTSAG